jgi:hypothetical protein
MSTVRGNSLIRHEICEIVDRAMIRALDLGGDPSRADIAVSVHEAIERSVSRIENQRNTVLSLSQLQVKEQELRDRLQADLAVTPGANRFGDGTYSRSLWVITVVE